MKIPSFITLFFLFVLFSCGSDFYYQASKDIPGGRWAYRDTMDFSYNISDTTVLYNLYLEFKHADTFPNQNLYLKLYTRFPDGKRLSKPYSFDFFNQQGAPNGKCSGHTCNLRMVLQENAFFNQTGPYVLTVEQFTRRDSIPGVQAVGLIVEKTKTPRNGAKQ